MSQIVVGDPFPPYTAYWGYCTWPDHCGGQGKTLVQALPCDDGVWRTLCADCAPHLIARGTVVTVEMGGVPEPVLEGEPHA